MLKPTVHSFRKAENGTHTEYLITTVDQDGHRHSSSQRFSSFLALHEECYAVLGLKRTFSLSKRPLITDSGRKARVVELDSYLKLCARAADSSPPEALRAFLNIGRAADGELSCSLHDIVPKRLDYAAASEPAPEAEVVDSSAAAATPPPAGAVDTELTRDVYSTAFVLASNATEDMYSVWPWANRQMTILWAYLAFIAASQAFALASLVVLFPPVVDASTHLINCELPTESDVTLLNGMAATGSHCGAPEAGSASAQGRTLTTAALALCHQLDVAFSVPAGAEGGVVRVRKLEREVLFYENVLGSYFSEGQVALPLLQIVCCVWVVVQVYFGDFQAMARLLEFRDFNVWLLPLKGERPRRNSWVLAIPLLQYTLGCAIVAVSCCVVCSCTSGFDAVMNSLAFTFISEVAAYFNQPLLAHYSKLAIAGLDPLMYGSEPIYYLVDEYDEENSYGIDRWLDSWYVKKEDSVAGLLTDFEYRHSPDKYPHPHNWLIGWLRAFFFLVPLLAVGGCRLCLTVARQA